MKLTRRQLAGAYVQLMDDHSPEELAAALASMIRAKRQKLDVDLLSRDIAAEMLRSKGQLLATVTTAHELSAETKQLIEAALVTASGAKTVQAKTKVDAELLGGFIAETPEATYDGSVRRILNELEMSV